ncbi:MAG: ornithine carbamoyltransferase [Planctomycetota bacterium]
MTQHFLTLSETSRRTLELMLEAARRLRGERELGRPHDQVLAGRSLVMLFEKPSLRTRVSFELAARELGAHPISMGGGEVGLGQRESAADVARVLSGMAHGIAARVYDHAVLEELAEHASAPVINMLSDRAHPAQALADVLTIGDEFGHDLEGRTVAFVGDGNNVAGSLAQACVKCGLRFVIASPEGYGLSDQVWAMIRREAEAVGRDPDVAAWSQADPAKAVAGADVVYTDTFVSMGQEDEAARRKKAFEGFAVNEDLLAHAPDHAIVMHCLPAHRGEEVSAGVLDGPRSRVFAQAHNRLHAQKGLLAVLMSPESPDSPEAGALP